MTSETNFLAGIKVNGEQKEHFIFVNLVIHSSLQSSSYLVAQTSGEIKQNMFL